jgi:hypothetical protein
MTTTMPTADPETQHFLSRRLRRYTPLPTQEIRMAIIPPNWTAILNKQGPFSDQEQACAGQWPTCAVGEAAHRFPEIVTIYDHEIDDDSSPVDDELCDLGLAFAQAVLTDQRDEARACYVLIQARITALQADAWPN